MMYFETVGNSRKMDLHYDLLPSLTHKRQSCHHIESSQLICRANRLTGFYMMGTLAFNELKLASI